MMRNGSSRIDRAQPKGRAKIDSQLARELGAWVTRTSLPSHENRWSIWAQRLAGRHALLGGRWTSSDLKFLEMDRKSTVINRVIRQRWVSSIALFPRLQLTLRNILGGVFRFSEIRTTLKTEDSERRSLPAFSVGRRWVSYDRVPGFEYAASALRNGHPGRMGERALDQASPGCGVGKSPAPLGRAFKRLETDENLSLAWRRIAATQEALGATVKRIVASGVRTEERTARAWNASPTLIQKQTVPSPQTAKAEPDSFAEQLS